MELATRLPSVMMYDINQEAICLVMQAVPSGYKHIIFNERGAAVIEGTRMKVHQLALEHEEYGWSACEIKMQHPFLSMAQIHGALTYYFDNRRKIEAEIAEDLGIANEFFKKHPDTAVREKIAKYLTEQ